ncbi:hypothetical protein Clacol_008779 [Clathrus columnatus]|uniref:C-CAP/cofactor C-like domain-containing protein n=1 Tax=Clathrus columnatus TaxID=1419009 RepID=A0AAV5ARK0_9AGAM|nr:hypothetical protein Clacol_008779 [Clathrus columnatus]
MADNQLTRVNIDETHGTELSANFYVHFQTRKNEIATKIENVKLSGKIFGPSHPDIISITSDIANLRRDLIEATPHLPAYDQGKCEQQLKNLEESFSQMRAPRTKFTFKRNPAAAVGSKPNQLLSSPPPLEPTGNSNILPSVSATVINYSPPTSNLTLSSRKSEELNIWSLMGSDKTVDLPDSSDVTLDHLHNCFVNFFPSKNSPTTTTTTTSVQNPFRITALHGRDLNRTILVIPPIDGSVLLHNIHNSIIILACRQFRIHDSTNTTILLDVFSNPIIERSNNLRFGTFPEELKYALSADFDWIKPTPSPNWSQIEPPPYYFIDKLLPVLSRDPGGVKDYDVDTNVPSIITVITLRLEIFTIIPGFFNEIRDNEDPEIQQVYNIPPRFNLIDDSPSGWDNLKNQIAELNSTAPTGTTYKVLFIGRHGEGFHNRAISQYGAEVSVYIFTCSRINPFLIIKREEWDRLWSKMAGDETMTWGPDPLLTELGITQAKNVNRVWKEELHHNIPIPERLYSSPFSRAVHTAIISFSDVIFESGSIANPNPIAIIKEKLRERNGVSLCDKRNTRSYLLENYPQFRIEEGFTEEDELWRSDHRETDEETTIRLREALDEIFSEDYSSTYLSITAHVGAIGAIRQVLGAPVRRLPTGGNILSLLIMPNDLFTYLYLAIK